MLARRLRLDHQELLLALAATGATGLLAYVGTQKEGASGIALPLVLVLVAILMRRPLVMVALTAGLGALCEGPSFGLFSGLTSELYHAVYKELTILDMLIVLSLVSVGLDLMRRGVRPHAPRVIVLSSSLLVFAMVAGTLTGHAGGASFRSVILANSTLVYLLLLPLAIANLEIGGDRMALLVGGTVALAIVKAGLGLVEILGHFGTATVEGTSTTLTYYEPTANWLIMVTIFGLLTMLLIGARPPKWALLGSPLLVASLLLSYRRSFWIAGLLGLVLVVILASSLNSRRMLLPIALLIAAAVLGLGSTNLQSSGSPIVRRAASILPSKIEASREDRYRLDERANVLGAIDEHPLTGLGVAVPWSATFAPLSVEHPNGREYVHFAALWYWLKLGILGLIAYVGILLASGLLAWRVWQGAIEPWARAYGLATLCALVGLAVIETTASFTGVDIRFYSAAVRAAGRAHADGARIGHTDRDAPPHRGRGDRQSRRMIWLSRRGCSDEGA